MTASSDRAYAEQVAEKIKALNGKTFEYEGTQVPLSLYAAVADVQSGAHYEELYAGLHNAIKECKPFQEEA